MMRRAMTLGLRRDTRRNAAGGKPRKAHGGTELDPGLPGPCEPGTRHLLIFLF
jgi:hypothetical protein